MKGFWFKKFIISPFFFFGIHPYFLICTWIIKYLTMLMLNLILHTIQINCDYDNLNYSLYYAFTLLSNKGRVLCLNQRFLWCCSRSCFRNQSFIHYITQLLVCIHEIKQILLPLSYHHLLAIMCDSCYKSISSHKFRKTLVT
jgi:hypothetical protein